MLYVLKAYTLNVNDISVKLEGTRKEVKTLQKLYFLFFFNKYFQRTYSPLESFCGGMYFFSF